jgi:hypothetical protein
MKQAIHWAMRVLWIGRNRSQPTTTGFRSGSFVFEKSVHYEKRSDGVEMLTKASKNSRVELLEGS